ncbi:carboxymuconolactone decarboxylase family protein [Halobacillus fulvus]|nr:carboxymuconolactone decarboxylase family protein [Halobacillus fulvus]
MINNHRFNTPKHTRKFKHSLKRDCLPIEKECETMKKDAQTLLEEYRQGIERLSESLPDTIQEYNRFTGKAFEKGEVDRPHKHLMALAISLKEGDEASITYHMDQCIAMECTDQQIYETMAVAAGYGGGSAMSQSVITGMEVLDQLKNR